MNQIKPDFVTRYRAAMAQINHAYAGGDEREFELVLDELFASRKSMVLADAQRLSRSLLTALTRFRSGSDDSMDGVEDMPAARQHLDHVLTMTEEAAHRTLDLIEQSAPLADATARDAAALSDSLDDRSHNEIRHFLAEVRGNAEQVRRNLTEVMLAQSFQDLSGQVLRGVRNLVVEVEDVLQDLAALAGVDLGSPGFTAVPGAPPGGATGSPRARSVVTAQVDVDDLIAGVGV